ncbi:hypothetical protein [Alkalilimnicola sp. S0819]|uniref:hypothetical protein n=1 Tax=Alkalilimnicola sp. S0819 TaxID=2613922 RepID=UPI00126154E5|nr:hypothetical protein [Alkalilimnicola sp. S0819]KAB7624160.1 hypothetical protein F3N43_07160 [Alkalilimnicola sp. S0819]MPQ16413.1 hypothetical protein [Alkalilimnicola sp. S0819]
MTPLQFWRRWMLRYFPIFIFAFFSVLLALVGASFTVAFVYFPGASYQQTAAPLVFTCLGGSVVLSLVAVAVCRGYECARQAMMVFAACCLVLALPSLGLEGPRSLKLHAIGAPVLALWALSSRRYRDMLDYFRFVRETFPLRR